ncbi:hypothetical protein FRB94_005371 [Tulasnella sp. JGI-2019a]|nr:hypothetical protein FRB94_005371 [Tulasnella sp. JGI-2019a]KAG9004476.1 hypothetical protein FRB93_010253 [Tulasnella sp. JGI-2019a]
MFKSGLFLGALASTVAATTYTIADSFIGPTFLTGFNWEAIADPTHGAVNYVDQATAIAQNLTYTSSDTFIMRADYKTVTNFPTTAGRNSVRIRSNKEYTTAVTVLNLRHMPVGCGTWPAFWSTLESNWPTNGEIDIIEGVNDVSPNQSTLHTTAGCTMAASTMTQTGTLVTTDCNTADNGNSGCGVQTTKANSYGPGLNSAGGGYYAMERTSTYIKIWFWAKNEASIPTDITSGATTVNPANWGTPTADFVATNCAFSHFGPHNIIINLTFCGDWAGAVYPSTCPSTCNAYVNTTPSAFQNAYWDIASLKVYE